MQSEATTLEKAAKYICNTLDGLCPMMAEKFTCPTECNLDTLPWQCWISFFKNQQATAEREEQ
jgi:hypothetical protein